jgi:hypothetical protein
MRPFWIHQLAEYLIGVALIAQGFQDPEPLVPAVVGILVVLNAAIVHGPMGAFRLVDRRAHRWLDLVMIVVIIAAALQPWIDVEVTGRATLLLVVLPLGFLWFYTDWAERPQRSQRRKQRAGQSSEQMGRSAGRMAGNVYVAGKRAIKKRTQSDD